MKAPKLKVGCYIKLKNDLQDGMTYGDDSFGEEMRFDGYMRVKYVNGDGSCVIDTHEQRCAWNYTPEMIADILHMEEPVHKEKK